MANAGLLDSRRNKLSTKAITTALLILLILGCMYILLQYLQIHVVKRNPLLFILFPPIAACSLAAIIPLLMSISYQDDFKHLNPWNPLHFLTISKRCYSALANNNMKVAEKDL